MTVPYEACAHAKHYRHYVEDDDLIQSVEHCQTCETYWSCSFLKRHVSQIASDAGQSTPYRSSQATTAMTGPVREWVRVPHTQQEYLSKYPAAVRLAHAMHLPKDKGFRP